MKKIVSIFMFVLLLTCVYVGAVSAVSGQNMRPPTLEYIVNEITSYEYYVNVGDVLLDIESLWTDSTALVPDMGGGDEGGVGGNMDNPDWINSLEQWLKSTTLGKLFLTAYYAIQFVIMSVYDTISALVYLLKVMSVFLTGIPC